MFHGQPPPLCHYDPGNPLRRWSTEVQEGSHEEIRTLLLQMQVPRVGSHAMHFKTCWNGCRITLVGIINCLLPCREHGHTRGNCELYNEESSWTKENPYKLTEPAAIALAQVTTQPAQTIWFPELKLKLRHITICTFWIRAWKLLVLLSTFKTF